MAVGAAATEARKRLVLLCGLLALATGCSLDWSYPEGSGGGGEGATGAGAGNVGGGDGCDGARINIVQPAPDSAVTHGPIDFLAEVQCSQPPDDAIVWEISGVDGVFAVGYSHTTTVNAVGTFDLWVAVVQNDEPIASDVITFETE